MEFCFAEFSSFKDTNVPYAESQQIIMSVSEVFVSVL